MTQLPGSTFASRNALKLFALASGMTPGPARPARDHRGSSRRPRHRCEAGRGPGGPSPIGTGATSPRRSGSSPTPPRGAVGADEPVRPAEPVQVVEALRVLGELSVQLCVRAWVVPAGGKAHVKYPTPQGYLAGNPSFPRMVTPQNARSAVLFGWSRLRPSRPRCLHSQASPTALRGTAGRLRHCRSHVARLRSNHPLGVGMYRNPFSKRTCRAPTTCGL